MKFDSTFIRFKRDKMSKGVVLLVSAEFCFALATVFTKFVTKDSTLTGIEVTFFRFALGLLVAIAMVYKEKTPLRPNNISMVIWRGVLNTIAVILFFSAIQFTTVTNANMLNMTYPVFIFLVAPLFSDVKTPPLFFVFLLLSLIGAYLIIHPNFQKINPGDILGLLSGIVAAFSVISLRLARKQDSTVLILFYLMSIGFVLNLIAMIPVWETPKGMIAVHLIISAVLGVFGQIFLTYGYKFISARSGSIVSSSRILFAILFGIIILSESITIRLVIGGILIVVSLIGVSFFENKKA